jgi:hypothetical protein
MLCPAKWNHLPLRINMTPNKPTNILAKPQRPEELGADSLVPDASNVLEAIVLECHAGFFRSG